MTPVAVLVVVVIVALGVGWAVLVRILARRELAPAPVLVSGAVPPVTQWLPPALQEFARTHTGTSAWSDVGGAALLSGHRGEVRIPAEDVLLTASLQPHTYQETLSAAQPLRVLVDMPEFARRRGIQGLVLGRYPDKKALSLRAELRAAIRRSARAAGAKAATPRMLRTSTIALAGAVAFALALGVSVGPPLARTVREYAAGATASPSPSSPPKKTPPAARPTKPPSSASACPRVGKATKPPTRSASADKNTSCALSEAVRAAYLAAQNNGKAVTLSKVHSPKSSKKHTVTCQGATLVTCSEAKKTVVYLY